MTRKIETYEFDDAMTDVFRNSPDWGACGTIDDVRRRRMMNNILSRAPSVLAERQMPDIFEHDTQSTSGRFKKVVLLAAAFILGLVVTGIFVSGINLSESNTNVSPVTDLWFGEVLEKSGALSLGDVPAPANAPIPVGKSIMTQDGTAMMRLPTGIDWWMRQSGHGKVVAAESTHILAEVLDGESWFRVDPNRVGPSFSLNTRLGRIDVTGTIFVVHATPSDVSVSLLKGEVWVTRYSGERVLVKTGHTVTLSDGRQTEIPVVEQQSLDEQLVRLSWKDKNIGHDASVTDASDAQHLKSGRKSLGMSGGFAKYSGRNLDIQQIHREIQKYRKIGDWNRVAVLYRQLIQSAPGSEAAMVSRVALGNVYQVKLHRYNDALQQFNRYIRSGHTALLPEAIYGKCTTLKSTRNISAEKKCLETFVSEFPGAFQSRDAKNRLDALQGM
ncbi:MAG: FecR domain-containing protein [Deltaproteobacteria bacterium]|nr:FecR domain-containing protein [Deltaproteobacteria bacterium]